MTSLWSKGNRVGASHTQPMHPLRAHPRAHRRDFLAFEVALEWCAFEEAHFLLSKSIFATLGIRPNYTILKLVASAFKFGSPPTTGRAARAGQSISSMGARISSLQRELPISSVEGVIPSLQKDGARVSTSNSSWTEPWVLALSPLWLLSNFH